MREPTTHLECKYVVDQNARIVSVSESWALVARDNDAAAELKEDDVIGRSLFDFIADEHCQDLYKALIKKVRATGEATSFPFRCDTPERRRLMELCITQTSDGKIEFDIELLRDDEREAPCNLLDADHPRTDDEVLICSWCKCVQIGDDWLEIEDATKALGLSNESALPKLNHGICELCDGVVKEELGSE